MCTQQTKEIQPRDTSQLTILLPYLTAGWLGPSLWQEFCYKKDAALVILLTKAAWRSIRKKKFKKNQKPHKIA